MGTYHDSKIQKARKIYACEQCGGLISVGVEYLSYALGQRWRVPVHLECAVKHGRYRCLAIEDYARELIQ